MFLGKNTLTRMLKEAFEKDNLIIGRRGNAYYIQGGHWKLLAEKEIVPKEIIGEIIKLTGELPDDRECFCAGASGNQIIMNEMTVEIPNNAEKIEITDLRMGKKGQVRLLQFEGTGHIRTVDEEIVEGISSAHREAQRGEESPEGPFCDYELVYWKNNKMSFATGCWFFDDYSEMLKRLAMIPLRRNDL